MGEAVVDYRDYDFKAVWVGRSDVDQFDRALLDLALTHLDTRRVLEIGTGFGRLTPQLLRGRAEYVGIDFDVGGLAESRASTFGETPPGARRTWLAANAYHLPFADATFTSVSMVRVHHHLADPVIALKEIARVLVPGGTALITYSARSGFRSLVHDTQLALHRPSVANERRLLFAPGDHVQVRDHPLRQFITSRARFVTDLRVAGLEPLYSYGGAENSAARLLPLDFGVRAGRLWPRAPVFSTRWVVVRRPGIAQELRPWADILRCPRCRSLGPSPDSRPAQFDQCPTCGYRYQWENGLLDARYIPGGPVDATVPIAGS
jgi:SAM-dependent methyltransferase